MNFRNGAWKRLVSFIEMGIFCVWEFHLQLTLLSTSGASG